jgi:hypothetical protein
MNTQLLATRYLTDEQSYESDSDSVSDSDSNTSDDESDSDAKSYGSLLLDRSDELIKKENDNISMDINIQKLLCSEYTKNSIDSFDGTNYKCIICKNVIENIYDPDLKPTEKMIEDHCFEHILEINENIKNDDSMDELDIQALSYYDDDINMINENVIDNENAIDNNIIDVALALDIHLYLNENEENHNTDYDTESDSGTDYDSEDECYQCPLCNLNFSTNEYLDEHFTDEHNNYSDLCLLDKTKTKKFCGYKLLKMIGMINTVKKECVDCVDKECYICYEKYNCHVRKIDDITNNKGQICRLNLNCCNTNICNHCIIKHVEHNSLNCPFCRKSFKNK